MPGVRKKAWQVAYDEALLSADGTTVVARREGCAKGIREGRIAFYFHHYDPERSGRSRHGTQCRISRSHRINGTRRVAQRVLLVSYLKAYCCTHPAELGLVA